MKKRAVEALLILAGLVLLFGIVNLAAGSAWENTVKIDGDYYSTGVSQLTLTLITEEGTENMARFKRLSSLKIIPYKEAAAAAVNKDIAGGSDAIRSEINEQFPDCTDLSNLDFLSGMSQLTELDVSHCGVAELDFLEGLDNLKSLDLSYTNVTDLSPLTMYDGIETLGIAGLEADTSPLKEMKGLKVVTISRDMEGRLEGDMEIRIIDE